MNLLDKTQEGIYCIAEMSANHAGDLQNALKIVRAAKESGASCLKIQTYTPDSMTINCNNEFFTIKGGLWDGYTLYDLYKEASTPYEWHRAIKDECDAAGIDFLSTPFDEEGVDFLDELGVGAFKVASFELVDIPLIKYIAKKGKPMLVSCGMGSYEEISDAVDAILSTGLSKEKLFLLKCTSEYPAKIEDMDLYTIPHMAERFGVTVGLSDHSLGSLAPTVAVALGARVIEKHFCLSRSIKNPDSAFSSEPEEFAQMVQSVNQALLSCGVAQYGPTDSEQKSLAFRRSIFAVEDIAKDEVFTQDNIRVIRPGYGLAPKYFSNLLGKKSPLAYLKGTPIQMPWQQDQNEEQ